MRRAVNIWRSGPAPELDAETVPGSSKNSSRKQSSFITSLLLNETLVTVLIMLWLSVILYGEIIVFSQSVVRCGQQFGLGWSPPSSFAKSPDQVTRVLFVSDPRLISPYSFSFMDNPVLSRLASFYGDFYMRRSYATIQSFLRPEVSFLYGDMFDGIHPLSHEWDRAPLTSDQYLSLLSRFKKVFSGYSPEVAPRWVFNVSGNGDIAWNTPQRPQEELVKTYLQHFGELNFVTRVGNFEFVVLASGMFVPPVLPALAKEAQYFLASLDHSPNNQLDRVLLHHIPLWRPQDTPCGLLNSKGPLNERKEFGKVHMTPRLASERIMRSVRPKYVFTGNALDHCEVLHGSANTQNIPEWTLNTFSWLQGVRVPTFGFAILENETKKLNFHYCELPDQALIYWSYVAMGLLTIVLPLILAHPIVEEQQSLGQENDKSSLDNEYSRLNKLKSAAVVASTVAGGALCWYLLLVWIYL